jgi:defect-in-organelle-trafficking protein DotC
MLARCALCTLLIASLLGCSQRVSYSEQKARDAQSVESLSGLKKLSYRNTHSALGDINEIRAQGLQEVAMGLGAQAGLAARAQVINDELEKNTTLLDKVFNFNVLILNKSVLPPVLLEGRNSLNLNDPNTLRIADRRFKIGQQARFVSVPPNWRNYLVTHFQKPDIPERSLLPKDKHEKELWDRSVTQGWERGIAQANAIFAENLARLKEDYRGMLLYRKLLALNMVTAPFVATTELGITGDGEEIFIDDQVLRITALPQLIPDSDAWLAAVTLEEKDLGYTRVDARMQKLADRSGEETRVLITEDSRWEQLIDSVH